MPKELEQIKQAVFAKRPVLADIAKKHGGQTLKAYIADSWAVPAAAPDPVFLETLKSQIAPVYGRPAAEKAAAQLLAKPLVSTIDHHGIWGHPFFVNSALIYSLHFKPGELSITFSTESVSLNNTSSWSGSILWHGENLKTRRASFFTDRQKHLPVFSAPAITEANITRFKNRTSGQLNNLLGALNILPAQNFSAQACLMSQNLWQAVFPSAPALVYVPLETLVMKYLEKVFGDPGHLLSRLILTGEGRALWQKFFGDEHTFMFWGIDAKGRRQVLKSLSQAPEVLKLMAERKIYPSSPLCFAVLLFAGFACAGGFNQTTWLTQTKEKLAVLLMELSGGGQASAEKISNLPTQNFAESSLAWLKIGGRFAAPTAADLFLTGKDYYGQYQKLAAQLTLEQSLNLAMPEIYEVVVPKAERPVDDLQILQQRIFSDLPLEGHF